MRPFSSHRSRSRLPLLVIGTALLALFSGTALESARAVTLLQYDFEELVPWSVLKNPTRGAAGVVHGPYGTVNEEGSIKPSGGLLLTAHSGARAGWSANLASGLQEVSNPESNLGKLTLAFSLSASRALPIRVVVESYDATQTRSGGLETRIHPAAADFYQRYALDLSTFLPNGPGTFDASAPYVSFTFEIGTATGWADADRHQIRLDNVHYASPAYYVSPTGDDAADGRTEATAFASPQRAIEAAQAGDILLVMDGTYARATYQPALPPGVAWVRPRPEDGNAVGGFLRVNERPPVARFVRPGTPAAWITLKNHPGHRPLFSAHGQTAIEISVPRQGSSEADQRLSYIELRGLHIRGNGDTAHAEYPDEIGTWSPNTNAQGIMINGRSVPYPGARQPREIVHHVRVADNLIEYCTADGIFVEYTDWLFIENNRLENNCWATIAYAPGGLGVMGHADFDGVENIYKMLVAGNRVSGNRLTVKNRPWNKQMNPGPKTGFANGHGMIFDANAEYPERGFYRGRTLVQNNLIFNNGSVGIQLWSNHRMDLINNTVYQNGTVSPGGEIGFERSRDIRLINNILVALPGQALDRWFTHRLDAGTSDIIRANNLYWGGIVPPIQGINDLLADPCFVNPGVDPATADFRLRPESPARGTGRWERFTPALDLASQPRPAHVSPSRGAFE